MRVRVLFFGPAQGAAGVAEVALELAPTTDVAALGEELWRQFPMLQPMAKSIRFAVNESFVELNATLHDGDEVAIIPPVSGGSGEGKSKIAPHREVGLVHEPLDTASALKALEGDPQYGGLCSFTGLTRLDQHPEHGALQYLDYHAYEDMAARQMDRLADEVFRRWPVGRLVFLHRVGRVELGEASVFMAVACPHRAEAFEACRWLIETLKKEVPIWKREIWFDGAETWVDPTKQ